MAVKLYQMTNRLRYFRIKITNTYDLIKPCLFLYKTCGIFPYVKNNNNIVLCNIGFCFSLFIAIICTIYLLIAMYQSIISKEIEFDTVEGLLQYNCYFVLGTFITVNTCVSYKKRFFILRQIIEVSVILSAKELQYIACVIYTIIIIGYIFLLAQFPHTYSEDLVLFISKMYTMYITIVVFLMDMQYMSYVMILKICFQNINKNILKLKMIKNQKSIHKAKSINFSRSEINLQLVKLQKLQQRHHNVSVIVQQLNKVFTFHVIATVLMTFIEVTFGLYFFILHSQGRKGIDLEKQIWYNYFITSVTYYSLKIVIIVWVCQKAKNEASKTGIIVHEVILNVDNDEFVTELNLFSLQLLQCKNEFTSKCITVDAKLLTAIVSGIATYLLILIQFLKSKKNLSAGNNIQ
ncbi:uncharacterized protein LOC131670775 [Phymastichus coffea]|uniref:uncharacterized protein LOC131670775 n=1 Tax=Phymastichus coffea TaxID=108790 RepID=UPI00273A95FB|nr:uncharacterized protein LOC131670775 [Phymastichus coffea]